jgi:hypothetical protein
MDLQSKTGFRRPLARTAGWLTAVAALYGALLILDCYWNLFDWEPKWDLDSLALSIWILAVLTALGLLARVLRDRFSQAISLITCLFLLGLGIHVTPAEARSEGLLGRTTPSPTWYRATRLIVMSAPAILWVWGRRRRVSRHPT